MAKKLVQSSLILSANCCSGFLHLAPLSPATHTQRFPGCSGSSPHRRSHVIPDIPFPSTRLHSLTIDLNPSFHLDLSSLSSNPNFLAAVFLATSFDPLVTSLWNATHLNSNRQDDLLETIAFAIVDSVATGARVYLLLTGLQFVLDRLHLVASDNDFLVHLHDATLTICTTAWAALSLSKIKKLIFLQCVSGSALGRVSLYDQLIDFVLFLLTAMVVLDAIHVDLSSSLQSLFAAGGVGALLFSLASRGLAEQIVGGFILKAWDGMVEGNEIVLGDKTEGIVHRVGLVETEIMGYDNVITKIPNSQFTSQTVQNLSRVKQSRVRQTVRFKYKDLEKLPVVLADMKKEIRKGCPKLIDDGSKVFACLLQSYEPDHVSAYVNCHFNIPPTSGEFYTNREQVLLAIARAMKDHDVEFALPSMNYETYSSGKTTTSDTKDVNEETAIPFP